MGKNMNGGPCRHEHLGLCDTCGKPMCKDCGAACTCDHSDMQSEDSSEQA